eukprot:12488673-Ditylum_brightwellii.AAC.1
MKLPDVLLAGRRALAFCILLSASVDMGLSSDGDGGSTPEDVGSGGRMARNASRNVSAASSSRPI